MPYRIDLISHIARRTYELFGELHKENREFVVKWHLVLWLKPSCVSLDCTRLVGGCNYGPARHGRHSRGAESEST